MPTPISVNAYTYEELNLSGQKLAEREASEHLLRAARVKIRDEVIKPFFEQHCAPVGIEPFDPKLYSILARGVMGYGRYQSTWDNIKTLAIIDAKKWAASQNIVIPDGFNTAEVTFFKGQGGLDNSLFIYTHTVKNDMKNTQNATYIRGIANEKIKPMVTSIFGALLVIIKDQSKEMLHDGKLLEILDDMFFFQDGRFLCPKVYEVHEPKEQTQTTPEQMTQRYLEQAQKWSEEWEKKFLKDIPQLTATVPS